MVATSIQANGLFVELEMSTLNLVLTVHAVVALGIFILSEVSCLHVPYSKFAHEDERKNLGPLARLFTAQLSPRLGFFILYFVPLVSYLGLFTYFAISNQDKLGKIAPSVTYSILLCVGWCASFFKRCVEVVFVHIYSGTIPLLSVILITYGYSVLGVTALIFANQVEGYEISSSSETFVKDVICFVLYVIGFFGNLYSHLLLRWVRLKQNDTEEKRYYSPGEIGFPFSRFTPCPHYTLETIMFLAYGAFGATVAHFCLGLGVFCYLTPRTVATYKWYKKKGLLSKDTSSGKDAGQVSPEV